MLPLVRLCRFLFISFHIEKVMFISTVFKCDSETYTSSESMKTAFPAGSPEMRKAGGQEPGAHRPPGRVGVAMALL